MREVRLPMALTAALLAATAAGGVYGLVARTASPTVGDDAPGLSPTKWFNDSNLSWDKLKGRVILVENWATT